MVGMSDLGGVKFFNLAVETPAGDMELLECVLEGEQQQQQQWAAGGRGRKQGRGWQSRGELRQQLLSRSLEHGCGGLPPSIPKGDARLTRASQ